MLWGRHQGLAHSPDAAGALRTPTLLCVCLDCVLISVVSRHLMEAESTQTKVLGSSWDQTLQNVQR